MCYDNNVNSGKGELFLAEPKKRAAAPARAAQKTAVHGRPAAGGKEKNLKKILIVSIAAVLVVAAAAVFGISYFGRSGETPAEPVSSSESEPESSEIEESVRFPAGTKVSGINIAGMTIKEAKEALAGVEADLANRYGDAVLTFETERINVTREDLGLSFNTDSLLISLLNRSLMENKGLAGEIKPEFSFEGVRAKLADLANRINQEPVDSSEIDFNFDTLEFFYKDGKDGRKLNTDATLLALMQHYRSGLSSPVTVTVDPIKSKGVEEGLLDHFGKMGESYNYCNNSYNAESNMRLALSKLDRAVIPPGEVFSYHDRVGNSTLASEGWLPAGAWVQGRLTYDEYGGGICQTATILYHCALYSGLEIVERHYHLQPSTYCEIGLDATVDYPSLDMKVRNNTEYPIFICSAMDDDLKLHMEMYGYISDEWDEITLGSEQTSYKPVPKPEFKEDASLKPGQYVRDRAGLPGATAIAWRNFYKNGELIRSEALDDSFYSAIAPLYKIGKKTDTSKIEPGSKSGTALLEESSTSSESSEVSKPESSSNPSSSETSSKPSSSSETSSKPESSEPPSSSEEPSSEPPSSSEEPSSEPPSSSEEPSSEPPSSSEEPSSEPPSSSEEPSSEPPSSSEEPSSEPESEPDPEPEPESEPESEPDTDGESAEAAGE